MSKFSEYYKIIDRAAREAFREYDKADGAFRTAERTYNSIKQPTGGFISADYELKAARARADLMEAEQARKAARAGISAKVAEVRELRKKLITELEEEYSAKPSDVDGATLALLKSGILSGNEYGRLMRQAADSGNFTMARLVGHYAGQHAQRIASKPEIERSDADAREIQLMRSVELEAQDNSGAPAIERFDAMTEILNRCANNPGLLERWGEFTAPLIGD